MAGVTIGLSVNAGPAVEALNDLLRRGGDLEPALADIGETLLNSTRARFERQQAPDGSPWEPLDPKYQARKERNAGKILILEGDLFSLLRYQVEGDELRVGTDRIYGATHQFGDDSRGIPARPFLGLCDEDDEAIAEILQDYLAEAG